MAAFEMMQDEPWRMEKLRENFTYMRDQLRGMGFELGHTQTAVIPIYIRQDLRVDRRVFRPAERRGCVQAGRGDRVCSGEQRDVMAGRYQPLGEQRGELLPRPVMTGRCPPRDRRQHGDSDRAVSLALNGNVLRLPARRDATCGYSDSC